MSSKYNNLQQLKEKLAQDDPDIKYQLALDKGNPEKNRYTLTIEKADRKLVISTKGKAIQFSDNNWNEMYIRDWQESEGYLWSIIEDWIIRPKPIIQFLNHHKDIIWATYPDESLVQQNNQLYLYYSWQFFFYNSKTLQLPFTHLHPIIKRFWKDAELRKIMPYRTVDTIYFQPYIGMFEDHEFWLAQNKTVDYYCNETRRGMAITCKKILQYRVNYKEETIYSDNFDSLCRLSDKASKNGESDLLEFHVEQGLYALYNFDGTTILEGNAKTVVDQFKKRFAQNIDYAIYFG